MQVNVLVYHVDLPKDDSELCNIINSAGVMSGPEFPLADLICGN